MADSRGGGVISRWELYTIKQIKLRLGVTDSAWRSLVRSGFPVIRTGKRGYVSGGQVIEFFEGLSQDGNASQGNQEGGPAVSHAAVDRSRDRSRAAEVEQAYG